MPSASPQPPYVPRPTAQLVTGCVIIPALIVGLLVTVTLYVRMLAAPHVRIPRDHVALVRAFPADEAPLLARFGAGRTLEVTGRTPDWRWLEVMLWDGRHGWTGRPLAVLPWQISASPTTPRPLQRLPTVVTSVDPAMVSLPATSFTMGSPPGFGRDDEHPAHVVYLSGFTIDRTEVTLGQYWQCVEAHRCPPPTRDASPTGPHYANDPAFDHYPVIHVPWEAAQGYCRWRGKRLPTEAEWELAAGWDIDKKAKVFWPWGNTAQPGAANVGDTSVHGPAAVGSFVADTSPSGVLDMAGNVSEWVLDWYKVDYYRVTEPTDPPGPPYRRGAGTGRVVRGGSFAETIEAARTTQRHHREAEYGYPSVGFRCVQSSRP